MAEIVELVDKQDSFEIIAAQCASILAIEKAEQQSLATAAGKDPDLWDFSVFLKRSIPWGSFINNDGSVDGDLKPGLVSIYFDSDSLENAGSDNLRSQKSQGQFIFDCYGQKSSTEDVDGTPTAAGDELAVLEAERVARLVRNVIMAEPYTYLKLGRDSILPEGTQIVQKRYVLRRENLRPNIEMKGIQHVAVIRLTLRVDYLEFGPLSDLTTLDTLIAQCTRSETGEIYFNYEDT